MRAEKQLLLDEIKDRITGSEALVWTKYNSLTPDISADFRMKLNESGAGFTVVSKRLLLKAAEEAGITLEKPALEGHIGLVYASKNPIESIKAFYSFAKENKDLFEVLGGQFEGSICTAEEVKVISQLPSKDELRAQILGVFEAPMAETVSVMDAILTSIIHCLENKCSETA